MEMCRTIAMYESAIGDGCETLMDDGSLGLARNLTQN